MKYFKKYIALGTVMTLLRATGGVFAHNIPANTYNDHRLVNGVRNVCYWVHSSASAYSTSLYRAAENREWTGYGWNPIKIQPVSSNNGTQIDVYGIYGDDDRDNILAGTAFYRANNTKMGRGDIYNENWVWNKIIINKNVLTNTHGLATEGTLGHEFGHAFGLDHNNNNTASLMCQTKAGRVAQKVDINSHNAINHLY